MSDGIIRPRIIPPHSLSRATNSNRLNSQDSTPLSSVARTSVILRGVLPAGSPSAPSVLPASVSGQTLYFVTLSAQVTVKAKNGNSWGIPIPFVQGTGLDFTLDNSFTELQILNENSAAVYYELFVGFDGYIDNRLTISNPRFVNFTYPTYPVENAAASVNILDRSGTVIADINGDNFYAFNRAAILIFNPSTTVTTRLLKHGESGAAAPAAGLCYPLTSLNYLGAGDFTINPGAGTVNAVVSELYVGIAA